MEYGLPKLEQRAEVNHATEHVNAIGQFARDMAEGLVNFAWRQHAYYQMEEYLKNYQTSIETMHRRHKKRASKSASSESWILENPQNAQRAKCGCELLQSTR